MVTNICLMTCVLSLGQVGNHQSWQLAPQLSRGLDLVYHGFYKEKSLVPGVVYQRDYRLQTRMFVLEENKHGWEVALVTAVELLPDGLGSSVSKTPKIQKASMRLEVARVDRQGKVQSLERVYLAPELEGPPTIEHGFLVPGSDFKVVAKEDWFVPDPPRPAHTWHILGTELAEGKKCIKVKGIQQSANWKDKQSAGAAWQRMDQVCVDPLLGVGVHVEREIQHRDPARTVPTHSGTLRYKLDRQWTYPAGQLFESRKQDILHAVKFSREAEKYLPEHLKHAAQLDLLVARIKQYLAQREPPEPYNQVLEHVLHRIDAVRKGQILIQKSQDMTRPLIQVATPGKRVPDVVIPDLINKNSMRLYELLGRPILIIFYNPHTQTGHQTLEFAKALSDKYKDQVHILGLAKTSKVAEAVQKHKDMGLTFPLLDGTGLHTTFGVEATPRWIILDANGVLRGAYTGWGFQIADQIVDDLQKCLPTKKLPNP
jgi:peroxiredoxin